MNLRFESPFEQRAKPTARSVRAQDPLDTRWVIKEGGGSPFLFVDSITIPEEVGTGGTIDIELVVVDTALSYQGPDRCDEGAQAGWGYTTTAEGDWGDSDSTTVCHSGTGFTIKETRELSLNAPEEPGTYNIDLSVVTQSETDSAAETFPINVTEDGDQRPDGEPVEPLPEDDPIEKILPDLGGDLNQGLVILVLILLLLLIIGVVI